MSKIFKTRADNFRAKTFVENYFHIYVKNFPQIFFENLTITIPAFQTAQKFGLLRRLEKELEVSDDF